MSLYSAFAVSQTDPITETWLNFGQTENQCDDLYDYFPDGGMRIFYCHATTFLKLHELQALANMPMFLSGPHENNRLEFGVANDFGHYNPEFVQWLIDNLIPAAKDEDLRRMTQPLYDQYVKPLARTYYHTYQTLLSQPDYFQTQTEQYANLVKSHKLPLYHYEQYYDFADLYKKGYEGNVVKGAVAFWIRRSIDNTIDQFAAGLEKLLNTYEPMLLQKSTARSSTDVLTQTWLKFEDINREDAITCEDEQTWLPEYGVRGLYCHIKDKLNFAQVQKFTEIPVFLSGPHQNGKLDFGARFQFGHYNPEFVQWLGNTFIPEKPSTDFLQMTQLIYTEQLQALARTYYLVYRVLQLNPDYRNAEQQRYQHLIETQELPEVYSTANYFDMDSNYAELAQYGESAYTVSSAMTFWLRRFMDGTADEFIAVLSKFLKIYDVSFLNQFPLPTEEAETETEFSFKFGSYQQDDWWVVNSILVYDANKQLVQELTGFKAEQFGSVMETYNVEINDFNFDGYPDLRLPRVLPADAVPFFYWLYDPKQKQFVRNEALEDLDYPDFNPREKNFSVFWDKDKDKQYGEDLYQFTTPFSFEMVKQTVNKKLDGKTLVTVLERDEKGNMVVTDQSIR